MAIREHPPTNKEINDYVKNQKGLNPKQKQLLIDKSKETWFRQYVKDSNIHLKKLTKTVKKQIKQYYNKKGEREDKRGFIEPPPKGTNKKEIRKKMIEEKTKITRKEREQIKRTVRRAPSGRVYSPTEIHEGVGSKRAKAWRNANNIPINDYKNLR